MRSDWTGSVERNTGFSFRWQDWSSAGQCPLHCPATIVSGPVLGVNWEMFSSKKRKNLFISSIRQRRIPYFKTMTGNYVYMSERRMTQLGRGMIGKRLTYRQLIDGRTP